MHTRGAVDRSIDIEEVPATGLTPEEELIAMESAERPAMDDREYGGSVDETSDYEDAVQLAALDNAPIDPEDRGTPEEDLIGGVVGSRRIARYEETPNYQDRKWKRGDKHRGGHKPRHKDHTT